MICGLARRAQSHSPPLVMLSFLTFASPFIPFLSSSFSERRDWDRERCLFFPFALRGGSGFRKMCYSLLAAVWRVVVADIKSARSGKKLRDADDDARMSNEKKFTKYCDLEILF